MRIKKSILTVFVFGECLFASATVAADMDKPNILFILTGDLGIRYLGCYGSDYHRTPHIDALAADGMMFTQAYAAAPICSPTRASILTGRFPHRVHLTDALPWDRLPENPHLIPPNHFKELPSSHATFAKSLRDAGYHTAFSASGISATSMTFLRTGNTTTMDSTRSLTRIIAT